MTGLIRFIEAIFTGDFHYCVWWSDWGFKYREMDDMDYPLSHVNVVIGPIHIYYYR